jgi:hypothetical protein
MLSARVPLRADCSKKGQGEFSHNDAQKSAMICRFGFLLTRYEEMLEQGNGRVPAKRNATSGNMYEHQCQVNAENEC